MASDSDRAVSRNGGRVSRTGVRATLSLLLIALCLVVVLYAVTLAIPGDTGLAAAASPVLYNVSFILAAAIVGVHAATGGRRTRPWFVVAGGLALYVVGLAVMSVGGTGMSPNAATPADAFWLMFYPLAFVALLVLTKRSLAMDVTHSLLDSALVGVGAFAVGVAILDATVAPGMSGADPSFVITRSLYLLGDLVMLVLVLAVAQAFKWRPPVAWWFLIAGGIVFSLADAAYLVQLANGTYVSGSWIDLLWPVTALLVSLAAFSDTGAPVPPTAPQRVTFLAPSVAIVAAGGVLLWQPSGPLQVAAAVAAGVTILLAVVRLNVDVRESVRLTRQLRRSQVDMLTGLPNRRSLLESGDLQDLRCSVVVLGIDSFKDVNDTLGHDAGDRLLVMIADRLRAQVADGDVLARLEGDEFAVVLCSTPPGAAGTAAESLVRSLEDPVTLDGIPLLVTACAGVVEAGDEWPDLASMLRHAAAALGTAKAEGPGLVRLHSGEPGAQTAERLRMRAEARAALTSGGADFVVHYQPIVSLRDGSVLAVEALVRWRYEGELLQPSDFLPEIVRGGLMPDLTRLMLTTSLRELRDNVVDLPVSVNVPPDLMSDWILAEAPRSLSMAGVQPRSLIIEITEEAIMKQPEVAAHVLQSLRSSGVRILLDDFGTGWSGLSSLRDLIVDGLKIDHSFVSRLHIDPSARAIVRSIALLAADLDLMIVYEGVDEPEVLDDLTPIGRCYVQSFTTARPMSARELAVWMDRRRVAQDA